MNYISLYRKYRPKSFGDVVGQKYIVTILKNAIKYNKVANAYIFAGLKGTGKTSIAKIFANAINCLHNDNGDVCKTCDVCKSFACNNLIDIIELDAASNNGVEEIRKINDSVQFLPTKLTKKVYIIDEAHMLTIAAWNALLKTVEEPPEHVIFIFATTEFAKIPSTIVSRCQCFQFNRISEQDTIFLLGNVCKKEKIVYDNQSLQTIAKITNGSLRDSLSILEQAAIFSNNNITNANLFKILGLTSMEETITFLNCLNQNNLEKCIATIKDFYKNGVDLNVFCNLIIDLLIDKIIYLQTKNEQCLNKTTLNLLNRLEINNLNKLNKFISIWQETFNQISSSTDKINILSCAILKCIEHENNLITNISKEKKFIKQPESINNDEPLFVLKERHIHKEQTPPIKKEEASLNNIEQISNKDILFAAIANKNKSTMDKINDLITKIKNEEIVVEKQFSILQTVYKVFCASKNCVVLAFKDAFDAKIFNQNTNTKDFLQICCRYLDQPFYFAGFTIDELTSLKKTIQEKKHESIPDIDTKKLTQILNKDQNIQQLAYVYVYQHLKKDNNEN